MLTKSLLGTATVVAVVAVMVIKDGRSRSHDEFLTVVDHALVPDYSVSEIGPGYPLASQYIDLSSQLANLMTDEELEAGITQMSVEVDRRNAEHKIESIRESLQEVIESYPDTPSAEAARNALQGLEQGIENSGGEDSTSDSEADPQDIESDSDSEDSAD